MRQGQLARAPLGQPWPGGLLRHDDLADDYRRFLQADTPPYDRRDQGLQAIFREIFPIKDFSDTAEIDFVSYELMPPRQGPDECRRRGETYGRALKVTLRLIVFDCRPDTQERMIRDIKEQEIYFGELPELSPEGTFVVLGIDRVVTRQLADSPGVRFYRSKQEHRGLRAQIRPHRGSWLSFEQDRLGRVYFRIDNRKKKLPATVLLRALGLSSVDIVAALCEVDTILLSPRGAPSLALDPARMAGKRATRDVSVGGELIVKKHRKFVKAAIKKLVALGVKQIPTDEEDLVGCALADDVIDQSSGEVLRGVGEPLIHGDIRRFEKGKIESFRLVDAHHTPSGWVIDTLRCDATQGGDEAVCEIYRALRPGDPPTVETARHMLEYLFFDPARYDLSNAGRSSLHRKLYQPRYADFTPSNVLLKDDIIETLRELLRRQASGGEDDASDLIEAVSRDVGFLAGGAVRLGLARMERAIKERMSMSQELDTLMPHDLVNARPLARVVADFFAFSRLSERADLINPAAEFSQRRKLSFSSVDSDSFQAVYRFTEMHPSWLGRLCVLETPRGGGASPSMGCLFGEDGQIFSTSEPLDHHGRMQDPDYKPPGPWEMLGPVAGLIPFVERDAPETAALGVNALRSALPSLRPEPPLVGTGLEAEVAHASGLVVNAREGGVVSRVWAREVVVSGEQGDEVYRLHGHDDASRGPRLHQHPVVRVGQRVGKGDLLAVGPGVIEGEAASGHNLLAALLPGHTLGASLIVSERVIRDGCFTTLHLREYRAMAADTSLGSEVFSAQIPGADPGELEGLDPQGLPLVGRRVEGGEILIGKIRMNPGHGYVPEGEEPEPPQDISLRLPPGRAGVVVSARIEGRRDAAMPKKCRYRAVVVVGQVRPLEAGDLLGTRHGVKGTVARVAPVEDMPLMPDGRPVDVLLNPGMVLERGAAGLVAEMLAASGGVPVLIPPFSGVEEGQIRAALGVTGAARLRDGQSGEWLDQEAAVGPLYMLKLPPLAGDVLEARSTGPYDPLTEQPVAGEGQPGGQEIDENTIAALMAHGAGYTLRELLQHKADDPAGRRALAASLSSHDEPEGGVAAGLDALMRELRAGALDIQALDAEETAAQAAALAAAAAAGPPPAPVSSRARRGKKARSG